MEKLKDNLHYFIQELFHIKCQRFHYPTSKARENGNLIACFKRALNSEG
jgi:hypothetical protein